MGYRVEVSTRLAEAWRLDRRLFPIDIPYRDLDAKWWLVFDDAGRVVAYAAAKIMNGKCYLTRCGVSARHRGRGLQKRLIRRREAWARSRGCAEVASYVSSDNAASLNSLIACGYRACTPGEVGYGEMPEFLTVRKAVTPTRRRRK